MKNEIIVYRADELTEHIEVRVDEETVWLTQAQIGELFGTKRQAITKHLKNIFYESELEENSVSSILELTAKDGKVYKTKIYNLDAILSIGYRVNSKNATQFRIWANKVLKDYLLKGYDINNRMNRIEDSVDSLRNEVNEISLQISSHLIPTQGIFLDGQVFDAYKLASDIIRSAKHSIVLIDNYVDETTLTHLTKKSNRVKVLILTQNISNQLTLDIQKANHQYGDFEVKQFTQCHDRFLIVDDIKVYHLGASLKDLGRKFFAFSKMERGSVAGIINVINTL